MGAFDFGSWHHSRELVDAQGDTGLLTLDQLVELVLDHDRPVKLFIEIKHSEKYSWNVERQVVALLQRYGIANPASADQARAAVISFFPDGLKLVRNAAPSLPTVFLAPRLDIAPLATVLTSHRLAQAIGANGISHYIETLRAYPELVDLASRQGMIVYPGVVNNQRDALYSSDLGVPWIGTDHPARTNTWLRGDSSQAGAHPPTREIITSTTGSTAVDDAASQNCAVDAAQELSAIYGLDIHLAVEPSSQGVPARALFQAAGSSADFATYTEVDARLRQLGDGASAVLASRWSGGRAGGHAYLAINEGGQIVLYDPHTRQRSGWPPHWGQDAVARTAVGYLNASGDPVSALGVGVPLPLAAADAVGYVQGHPEDPNFLRRQAEYRAADPLARHVEARYAEPLGEVLDAASRDPDRADQLAADLSGNYGPCRVEMTHEHFDAGDVAEQLRAIGRGIPLFGPSIYGDILSGGQRVGTIHWRINRDKLGVLVAEHHLYVEEDFPVREFTDAVAVQLESYLQRSGVLRIESEMWGKAAYATAARGESWNPDQDLLSESLDEVKRSARELSALLSDEDRRLLNYVVARLDPDHTAIPTPTELAALGTPDVPDLGRQLLEGTGLIDPYSNEVQSGTGLHTINDLRGERPTWLPASEYDVATGLNDGSASLYDPEPRPVSTPSVGDPDPDFVSRQEEYRAQDHTTRVVDPTYAEPLGAVVDNPSSVAVARLAADLSGVYGEYRVEFEVSRMKVETRDGDGEPVVLTGDVLRGDEVIGGIGRDFYRDSRGNLVVDNAALAVDDEIFFEVANTIDSVLEPYYWGGGVHRIEEEVVDNGSNACVRRGFIWDPDSAKLVESLENMKRSARDLGHEVDDQARAVLRYVVAALDPARPDFPMPIDLAGLSVSTEPDLGARLLADTNWWGVKYRPSVTTASAVAHQSADPVQVDHELDFQGRQDEYRAENLTTRRVDPRYAEPLGDVVDSASSVLIGQLAEDLSGKYGPCNIQFEAYPYDGKRVVLDGDIISGGREVGAVAWWFDRDDAGNLVAHHEVHITDGDFPGREFANAMRSELTPYYMRSGVDRILSSTHGKSAYALAHTGETWDPDPQRLQESVDVIRASAIELRDHVSPDARIALERIGPRLEPEHARLPEPIELATLRTPTEPDLGRRLLEGTRIVRDGTALNYLQYLWNARSQSSQDCAHWVADVLSDRYGRPVHVDAEPSDRGVPARALFEAVGSRAEFATYTEISELLFQMNPGEPGQPGPAAIVVSSWAGGPSQGGHAYLAVVDGGQIHLMDPFTGERLGWPPYWGEGAVSRTAVGFLDAGGQPIQRLDGVPDELVAAAEIGFVQGRPDPNLAKLTPRQREVLDLLADGLSNREIAAGLSISVRTAETHVFSILRTLGVSDRTQLVVADPGPLTSREGEVLELVVVRGFTDREIAARLFIAVRTVDTHVSSILRKLGARNRVELVAIAFRSGLLEPGRQESNFTQRQAEYRAQEPATRPVQMRYAEALGDVVDNPSQHRIDQLAADLSGIYGPYRVHMWRAVVDSRGLVIIGGDILLGDDVIGFVQRAFNRDAAGKLVVHDNAVDIPDERFRFKGFSKALVSQLEPFYERSDVDRIELRSEDNGGYAWARQGFTWNLDREKLQESFDSIEDSARRLLNWVSDDAQVVLRQVVQRLDLSHPRLPEPRELADLATADDPDLGRQLMNGTRWYGVKHLGGAVPATPNMQSPSGVQTSSVSSDEVSALLAHNCAHLVADELSELYGRDFHVNVAATATGVPARALFEAAGSSARFATYDEVADRLRQLGDGSSAVLASRWAGGRQGGHAYLAVNEGGEIYLVERHTGQLSGWPPHWGQDTVARTAVGYLDADGNPVNPLHDVSLQLAAADAIGDVKGHQMEGDSAHADVLKTRYSSPDDVQLAGFRDRVGQLDPTALSPEAIAEALYRPLPVDAVTGFYEGRVSGFKTGEVLRAQQHVADTTNDAFFLSADIANLRGLNQACADRAEANTHFSDLADVFHAVLMESGAEVVPMRVGGDEMAAVVVGDISDETIAEMVAMIDTRVQDYARQHDLADVPHPKHPGQPEYNGVGLHVGYAEVLPGLDVRNIFDAADLGVDRSKTRSMDVSGGPGRAPRIDGLDPGAAPAADRGDGTRTRAETAGGEGQAAGRAGAEEESGEPLGGVRYPQPEELKRAAFVQEAAQLGDTDSDAFIALYEPLSRDAVSDFFDGRASGFKNGEVARAGQWVANTGESGFFVSAELVNLSGLNQHAQNRAEVANAHYRAICEIFRTEFEATGTMVVPMRTGGDRLAAIVVGSIDTATIDTAITSIGHRIGEYTEREGLAGIANPSNPEQPGVRLRLGYSDITTNHDVEDIVQDAERRMFGRDDSGDPRRQPDPARGISTEPDVPVQRQQDTAPDTIGDPATRPVDTPSQSQVADEALAQRIPPVAATELVHPIGDAQSAVERAQANAAWWKGLSAHQRRALIETYPVEVGNAEGIPPLDRHEANTRSFQDWLAYRDQLQARLDSGVRLGYNMSRDLFRFSDIEAALRRAAEAAQRAGVDGPHLLQFHPFTFRDAGSVLVSFGVDPYLAETVSWHIPGRGMTIDELGPGMGSALNNLMSVLREDPTASAASMMWIGYDTMADDAAQIGGEGLYSDIRGFNAGRDAWAMDGGHFSTNHVFGHCLGSSVAGYAGEDGRMDGQVRTVTMFGSPGAGPMDHMRGFGPGIDVYVAASSTDPFTWRGGETPGSRGNFMNGLGVDPAMDFFGAQRITAEFPLTQMTSTGDYDIHNFYNKFVDKSTGQRNESLANFGRIAAGRSERVEIEGSRTVETRPDQTTRVHDPAATRPAQLEAPASSTLEPDGNCAHGVAEVLSDRYRRDVRIEAASAPTGVAARKLFEAIGSGAEFASYAEVAERLVQLGSGSSAVLASRWAGVRVGGHAYLAVNDGGEIYLMEPRTGRRSGWPPHWGEHAVSRTAVGYLDEHGNPVHPLHDRPLQLAAAEAVGDVKGMPGDPDFQRAQEEYRGQDPTTRRAQTQYAEPLGDVVDNASDMARVQQLAADLSGVYGPYRVEFDGYALRGVFLDGEILSGDTEIGFLTRIFMRDADDKLFAYHTAMAIEEPSFRGQGFSKALLAELERYYERSGVDYIRVDATSQGSYAWARQGFTWDPDPSKLQASLDNVKDSARLLAPEVSAEAQAVLDNIVRRLEPDHPRLPEPIELANLATTAEPNLGQGLLDDTVWHGIKYLPDANPQADRLGGADVDVPLQVDASESPDPVSVLGLSNHSPGSLSDAEVRAVYVDGELRLRELDERLIREGVSIQDRARTLSDLRDSLRARTRDLMSNRVVAEFLTAYETNPTFEELVAHNEAKGLAGDAVYEAIVDTATHSHYAPGTLSDIETTDLYSQFELQMRAYHQQLIRDGVRVDERARILSELRSALRDWTRDLMNNRVVADFLAVYEGRPNFQDLVAHNEARGLLGDAVYEAIIDTATHSHYARGTLSDAETRTVYTTFELRMREVHEHLLRRGAGPEEQARTLYGMRAALRSWTRALMEDRELAEWLNENEPNPAFEALVERQRKKGREGVAIYEAIIASATRSRASVNESLGIDPDNPPPLPRMRGATDGGDEEVASTTWYSSRNDRPDGIRDLIARIRGAGVDSDTTVQVERAVLNRYQGNLQLRQTQLRQEFLNNKTAELVNKGTPADAAEATARQQVDDYLGSERAQHLIARDAVARTIEWTDKTQFTQVLHDIAAAPGSTPSIFDDTAERFAARGASSAIDQLPKALKSTLTRIDNAGADPAVTEQAKSLIHDRYQEYLQAPTENVYRDVLVEKRAGFARDGFPPAVADRLAERETVAFTQTPKARRMIDSVAANNTNQWFEKARVSAERDGVNLADRLAETYRHEQQPLSETELRAVGDRLTAMRDNLGAVEHRLNTILEQSPDLVAKGAGRWLAGIATQLDVLNRLSTAMENRIAAGEPITRRTMSDAVLHGPEANIRGYEGEIRLAEQFDNIHALGPLVDTDAPTGVRMASEVDVVTDEGRVWHESKTNDIDSQRGEQKKLEAQARRQLYISYLNPEYWVDDIPPQVKWHFMNGVHPTVKARLEAIRIEDETGHIVDNHHIEVIDHGRST
jgi:DNA-binding NarL/FixJ family response regulator/GNAT superfamily N-acetyltransferase